MSKLIFPERISSLFGNPRVKWLVLSAIMMVLLSYYRAWTAGTLLVDGHSLSGIHAVIVFFSFLAALTIYSISLYKLWNEDKLTVSEARLLAYFLMGIFTFMLPMLSNDIFSLLMYGDAANRGADVYTDIHSLSLSPYFRYVSSLWKDAPCVYGPVCLSASRLANFLGNGHFFTTLVIYKAIVLVWGIIFIEVMRRICLLLKISAKHFLFIALNPLFMLQGIAQLHCDAIAIALTGCMIYFFLKRKWYLAFMFAGLSIAAKMSFVLMLPFLITGMFLQKENWRSFFSRTVIGTGIATFALTIVYLPFYTSINTVLTPFKFINGQNPATSVSEIIGDIIYFAPQVITGKNAELQHNVYVVAGVSQKQLEVWLLVKKICQVFALVISVLVFLRFWKGRHNEGQWIKAFTRLLLLFLLFYSHIFYSWYLMMVLPFIWYEGDIRFMQWLFVLTCLCNTHDILYAINKGSPVYFGVLVLTFLSTMVFVWRFRLVFFRSVSEAANS